MHVRERRMLAGKTQDELAEALGVSFQQLQKYESGSNRIGAGRLYALALALGTDVNSLFQGCAMPQALPLPSETAERLRGEAASAAPPRSSASLAEPPRRPLPGEPGSGISRELRRDIGAFCRDVSRLPEEEARRVLRLAREAIRIQGGSRARGRA